MEIMGLLLEDDDIEDAVTSFLLEDSDSSSSDEEFEFVKQLLKLHETKNKSADEYSYNLQSFSDDEFLQIFRINRPQVLGLIDGYKKSGHFQNLRNKLNSTEYSEMDEERAFSVFLYFAGHSSINCKDVAKKFNLSTGVFLRVIANISMYLNTLTEDAIVWPSSERQQSSKTHYFLKQGFPDVIGCIGSTEVAITRPLNNYVNYWNSEDDFRFVIQGVCNEHNKFIDLFIGSPGLTNSSMVFKNSPICKKLNDTTNTEFFLLTNSNYPTTKYLISPYFCTDKPLTQSQINFNKKLEDCATYIIQTFQLVKRRFRQLHHLKLRDPTRIVNFIKACCVLHNLADIEDHLHLRDEDNVIELDLKTSIEDLEDIELNDSVGINY